MRENGNKIGSASSMRTRWGTWAFDDGRASGHTPMQCRETTDGVLITLIIEDGLGISLGFPSTRSIDKGVRDVWKRTGPEHTWASMRSVCR